MLVLWNLDEKDKQILPMLNSISAACLKYTLQWLYIRDKYVCKLLYDCKLQIMSINYFSIKKSVGRGGGQVVSMLAFYSDNPSSNPA